MAEPFGTLLRRYRTQRGLSIRDLAKLVYCGHSHLQMIEVATAVPTEELAKRLDHVLDAAGALSNALPATAGEDPMRRRTILAALTALATGAAVAPMVSLEATRQGILTALGNLPDVDEWEAIVAGYARDYQATAPSVLVKEVASDLVVLQQLIAADPGSRELRRVAARLGVMMALALGSTDQIRSAQRWWSMARQAAIRSGCAETVSLVRGEIVVRGLYERRPLPQLLTVAASPVGAPCFGTASVLAGRAQAYAMLGQTEEAHAALGELADTYERLPAAVTADDGIFGWSEDRLHHTTSYVNTHLRNTTAAYAAQDRALAMYPPTLNRSSAMVRLHRARCLVIDGDLASGLDEGAQALDLVSVEYRGGPIGELGRVVLAELPPDERTRPEADELRQRLAPAIA